MDDEPTHTRIPMVSIVITAYNAERFIGACIRAALAQTYPDFEVIVVDDGSTDRTAAISRGISDTRLRVLTWGRLGRPRALNAGIAAAKGDYIAIDDADDLCLPHRLQYSMAFLRNHPDVAYLGTRFAETEAFLDAVPEPLIAEAAWGDVERPVWPSRSDLYRRNLFNNSTLMYPKSTWTRIGGYDEELSNSEDYDFYLRALQCGPAVLLPGRTVLWYTNPNGFFKQKSRREHFAALRVIKGRAHRLLHLPLWLRWYQPLWELGYHAARRYPGLLALANGARRNPGPTVDS
jgi:glycosyltransferase involved in cell wall biosynthesis